VTGRGLSPRPSIGQAVAALPFDTVILAGGQASRLGGADKPAQLVGDRTLAAAVAWAAVGAGSQRIVLVGPRRPELAELAAALPGGLITDREEPPGAGPLPALRRGLGHVHEEWTVLLAADLPFLRPDVLVALLAAARASAPGAVLADGSGRPQWLAGCWRTAALRSALRDYSGAALRGLLAPLDPVVLRCDPADGQPPPWLDCDTPAELDLARRLRDREQVRAARPGVCSASRPADGRQADEHTPGLDRGSLR
jgi:molybdopterin-guanine dinucleotide biosynthesis protein A